MRYTFKLYQAHIHCSENVTSTLSQISEGYKNLKHAPPKYTVSLEANIFAY